MPSYPATVIADGPAAYWRLNLNANDSVGTNGGSLNPGAVCNQPNGPLMNGTSLCASFSATGSISLPALATAAAFTLEAWIKYTVSAQMPLFSNRPLAGSTGEYIGFQAPQLFWYNGGSVPAFFGTGVGYNDGLWHHVVWTTDGINGVMTVDGVAIIGTAFAHPATASNTAYIGWDKANNSEYYQGYVAELAIYNKNLSMAQITAHYAARNNPASSGSMLAVF